MAYHAAHIGDAKCASGWSDARPLGVLTMVAVHFDLAQDFPVGLDALWATLGRSDYIEQKYRALGSTSLRLLKCDVDSASIEVELERQALVDRGDLPAWARILSGRHQAMRHHTRWRRTAPDRVEIELAIRASGLGVGAQGTGHVLELAPNHSRMTLHFELVCSNGALPAAVLKLFGRQLEHALQADHAFTLDYLARPTINDGPRR